MARKAPIKRKTSAAAAVKKYVYLFGKGMSDGNASMKELLGGKGANLAEMTIIGLPQGSRLRRSAVLTFSNPVCSILPAWRNR